ncbi:thiaminase II [Pseudonocardia humida]|uniref:Aminopyrimidine aminohydrolase n=1 Tax=Pseudonocardia humida TaxID=2800819 RepID=A0ABT0ZW93_9PSEU|nr:thiaminase II [Pseudonocardia humida]MCO1655015.1 thiaminase II [Pseudonocardia humida]
MVTAATRTRDLLWSDIEDVYAAILDHPFLAGLADGSLPREAFRHYVVQDSHYLRGYARALAVCAAKAPDERGTTLFAAGAGNAVAAEQGMHAGLLDGLGTTAEAAAAEPIAPTTQAYLSYLLATAYGGSFPEALGAVLPCYWIYARVGAELVTRGSPDPLYATWIAAYGGEAFQAVVDSVLELTDRVGAGLAPTELAAMRRHFATTARYEWMFWDAGYRRETWPV